MPSQLVSDGAGVPGAQFCWTTPFTHELTAVRAHAPVPQLVGAGTYPSSFVPLQLSSTASHVVSLAAGAPGVQLSRTAPFAHVVVPVRAQAPSPHVVACDAYSSSIRPSQSSSMPSQVVEDSDGLHARHASWFWAQYVPAGHGFELHVGRHAVS